MRDVLVIILIIAAISGLYIHLDLVYAQFLSPTQNEGNTEESNRQNATTLLTYNGSRDHIPWFKISYPSNLREYDLLTVLTKIGSFIPRDRLETQTLDPYAITGHGTTQLVGFTLPSKPISFTVAVAKEPGNFLLRAK